MFGGRDATMYLFISIFIVSYALIFVPILPESPKLLYSQRNYEKTREALSQIAHINGLKYKKLPFQSEIENHIKWAIQDPEHIKNIEEEEKRKADFMVLFRNSKFCTNIVIITVIFTFNVFSVYMLSFMLKYLPGDKYENLFILGLADFIPSIVTGYVMMVMSTKRGLIMVHAILCAFVIAFLFFEGIEWLAMPLIFFIRFSITMQG